MLNTAHIMLFEAGTLPAEETVALFKHLVDTGDIWRLSTDYLDKAAYLIENNLLTRNGSMLQ